MRTLNQLIEVNNNTYKFDEFANILLNKTKLIINDDEYFFTEIEFYFYSDSHKDCNVHTDERQLESNSWYIHTSGRGGIDLTFGNKHKNEYGGVLIRGLKYRSKDNEITYIDGPKNVYEYIKKKIKIFEKNELQKRITTILNLKTVNDLDNFIFNSPRVGLVKETYKYMPYRYIIDIDSSHKFKNKELAYAYTLKIKPDKKDKIIKMIGYKFNLEKYIERLKLNNNVIKFLE